MGNEMGGLVVSLFADLMYNDLDKLTSTGKADEAFLPNYLYCNHFSANLGSIDSSFLENCPLVLSCFIGRCSHVISSTLRSCTILSSTTNSTLYVLFIYLVMFTESSRVI